MNNIVTQNKFYIKQQPQVQTTAYQKPLVSTGANCDVLDIRSRGKYPANILSNFAKTDFIFDGVKIKSIEGFLQSLKVKEIAQQEKLCSLDGFEAKKASKSIKRAKEDMLLFWDGQIFRRDSQKYKDLLKQVVELQEKKPNAPFEFGSMKISSVNAFLLALKVQDPNLQKELAALPLDKVKEAAKSIKPTYDTRVLYWKGLPIERTSKEYSNLLDKIYNTRFQKDAEFRKAIRFSKQFQHLTHSIGKHDIKETILTEKEFISHLENLQNKNKYFYRILDTISKWL